MKVTWSSLAGGDIHRLTGYYRRIDPDLSISMRRRIEATVDKLLYLGDIGTPMADGRTKKISVLGAPFIMLFRMTGRELVIVRVRHVREDWTGDY